MLRDKLDARAAARGARVHFPPFELCTDNGAMIAYAAALRLAAGARGERGGGYTVRPRWPLSSLARPSSCASGADRGVGQ
jgi:N6-L-threonylcarbamoyladenine synthase